jgi:hypothetical protein
LIAGLALANFVAFLTAGFALAVFFGGGTGLAFFAVFFAMTFFAFAFFFAAICFLQETPSPDRADV